MITIPGRIPIRIHPIFWFMILIIGWVNSFSITGTMIWAFVILFSVLIHEYGHALTALAFGQKAHIELVGLGGVTQRSGSKIKLWQEFIIVFNGPLAGFLLFVVAYFLYQRLGDNPPKNLWTYLVTITMYANFFWTIVNLLPVHPLDGGRLLSIILESFFGIRGIKISLFCSSILSVLIGLFFFSIGALLGGSLFLLLAFESYRAWRSSLAVSIQDRDDDLQQMLKQAEEVLRLGHDNEAQEQFAQIRAKAKEGVIYLTATEHMAAILSRQGQFTEAYKLLEPIQDYLSMDSLRLLHQLAYRDGKMQEAIRIGERSYQVYPSYDTALTMALSYASLGDVRPAVGWLRRAIDDGLPNLRVIINKEEFNKIRNSSTFQELLSEHLGAA